MRGQVDPRCPECGRAFDFADATTFDVELPGVLRRTHRWLAHRRFKVLAVLLALTIGIWWQTSDGLPFFSPRINPGIVNLGNIGSILKCWFIQQLEDEAATPFDPERAVNNLPGHYSAVTEYSKGNLLVGLDWWARSRYVFLHFLLFMSCLATMVALWRGRVRRLGVAGLVAALLFMGDLALKFPLLGALFPGNHAFLHDYVCLPDVDLALAHKQGGMTIAVYEKKPWREGVTRVVGFADGHVRTYFEDKFIQLLKSQGHELDASARREDPTK